MCKCNMSETLTKLRADKGVTQEDVAAALSVSNKTVSKWENGVSEPNLSMLVRLAKYYNVTSDALLGIAGFEKQTTENLIKSELEGLDRKETALKAFDIVRGIIPATFDTFASGGSCDEWSAVPEKQGGMNRFCISTDGFHNFAAAWEDVNLSVMLMRNKSNFAWLNSKDGQEKIALLFTFLSDADALKLCYFIHSTDCSENFTADYISKNTGILKDKTTKLLDFACDIGLCSKVIGHLSGGKTDIYRSFGDGNILALITLAYELMCGTNSYNYYCGSSCKMIGGKE